MVSLRDGREWSDARLFLDDLRSPSQQDRAHVTPGADPNLETADSDPGVHIRDRTRSAPRLRHAPRQRGTAAGGGPRPYPRLPRAGLFRAISMCADVPRTRDPDTGR